MIYPSTSLDRRPRDRAIARTLVTAATAAVIVGMASVSASAAPGDTSSDSVVARVNVDSVITLNLDQSAFDLNGVPGTTVTDVPGADSVTGRIRTNNIGGYSLSVLAEDPVLTASIPGNGDTIPIGNLQVISHGVFTPLSDTTPLYVLDQNSRADPTNGDSFYHTYRVDIPDVNSDTYSVTVDYTVTAKA